MVIVVSDVKGYDFLFLTLAVFLEVREDEATISDGVLPFGGEVLNTTIDEGLGLYPVAVSKLERNTLPDGEVTGFVTTATHDHANHIVGTFRRTVVSLGDASVAMTITLVELGLSPRIFVGYFVDAIFTSLVGSLTIEEGYDLRGEDGAQGVAHTEPFVDAAGGTRYEVGLESRLALVGSLLRCHRGRTCGLPYELPVEKEFIFQSFPILKGSVLHRALGGEKLGK